MLKNNITHTLDGIEFTVIYSGRRTLGISILPDTSVIVRVPYLTSHKTISRIIKQKSAWIIKHRASYLKTGNDKLNRLYVNGEAHLFRGRESVLNLENSVKPYIRFNDSIIEIGLRNPEDPKSIKRMLYKGYRDESLKIFPEILNRMLIKHEKQMFRPTGLVIRSMKRRWGSCSNRGVITLSTELIKLSDLHIEYVIVHELCHLKHHNHGAMYYTLLSELFPDWKQVRKDLRRYIQ